MRSNVVECVCVLLLVFFTNVASEKDSDLLPELLYANGKQIDALKIGKWTNRTVVAGITQAISLDFHYEKGLIFWTDITEKSISVIHTDSVLQIQEDIIRINMGKPSGLAVDWIYNHLYWTDVSYKHIQISNLDGTMRRTLIDYKENIPATLALDPINRIMFVSITGSYPRIERCGLDGLDREIIVYTDLKDPTGITIDRQQKKIYWTDNGKEHIKSCRFDGSGIKTITKSGKHLKNAIGIAVFMDKVYWTDWEQGTLLRTDKFNGNKIEIVHHDMYAPVGLKVFSSSVQSYSNDQVCDNSNGGCSHLCLPKAPWSKRKQRYTCQCPNGFELESDYKTCTYGGRNIKLLIADGPAISQVDLDTLSLDKLNLPNLFNTFAIDFHFEKDLIFWSDVSTEKIYVSYLSGGLNTGLGFKRAIVDKSIKRSYGLAVDWIYDHLYWTDKDLGHIQVANLDGTMRKTLVYVSLGQLLGIALLPEEGVMFFTLGGIIPRIDRCSMDGSERTSVVIDNIGLPIGITIDIPARRIYWTDVNLHTIQSATFDGTDRYTIVDLSKTSMSKPFGIDLLDDTIYWSNFKTNDIYETHKYQGNNMKAVITGLQVTRHIKIKSKAKQFYRKGSNLCGEDNGGCAHLCLPVSLTFNKQGYTCECADFYTKEDSTDCVLKDSAKLIKDEL